MLIIYYLEKLTLSKLVGIVNFSERKFAEMHWPWRAKRYKLYLGKCLFLHYCLQLSFVYKIVSQIYFDLFCSEGKRLLSEFFRKWRWALITTTLISSCHWKSLVLFCLWKKRLKKAFFWHLQWIMAKSYTKTNYAIQNKNKLAI